MFILVQLQDTIRIPPETSAKLQEDILHYLRQQLNIRYCNKVIYNIGLCIIVHSILAYDEPRLFPGDAGCYIRVNFRVVVFQPFNEEVIVAKIKQSDPETGLMLSLDFFDHIHIPPHMLPENTEYEEDAWVWNSGEHKYYFDVGNYVRFKVTNVQYVVFTFSCCI